MKQLRNKSSRRIRVPLPNGEVVRVEPGRSIPVDDETVKTDAVKALILAGKVEISMSSGGVESARGADTAPPQSRGPGGSSPFRTRRGDR